MAPYKEVQGCKEMIASLVLYSSKVLTSASFFALFQASNMASLLVACMKDFARAPDGADGSSKEKANWCIPSTTALIVAFRQHYLALNRGILEGKHDLGMQSHCI